MYCRLFMAGVVMGALTVIGGEYEKLAMTAENWSAGRNVSFVEEGKGGGICMKVVGSATILSMESFAVDPAKTYRLSGSFRSVGKENGRLLFGLAPLDADKRTISPVHVVCVPETETELVAACKVDDTVIKVRDGSGWRLGGHGAVAFDADDSGKYADLPNSNVSGFGIASVERKGDHWEITLTRPSGKEYPAGTKVRQQNSGSSYMYSAAANVTVPGEWQTYSGEITGMPKSGNPPRQFWPGTAYVRVIILANYAGNQDNVMLIDDIALTEQ